MKEIKNKKQSHFFSFGVAGLLLSGVLSLSVLALPRNVFASGQGEICSTDNDCDVHLFCDKKNTSTCLPGVAGTDCSVDNQVCQVGTDCSNGKTCQAPPAVGALGSPCTLNTDCNSQYCDLTKGVNNGVCGTKPSSGDVTPPASGGQGNCPDGLTSVNGLCLAPNQFKTGIAGSTTLVGLLTKIIEFLLTFSGIIAVVMLVIGGYWYMASGGNEEQAEKGKKTIINFVLGLVVIIMAYSLVTIISNTLQANTFTK